MTEKETIERVLLNLLKQQAVKWMKEGHLSIEEIKTKLLSYDCNSNEVTEIIEYLYTLSE